MVAWSLPTLRPENGSTGCLGSIGAVVAWCEMKMREDKLDY